MIRAAVLWIVSEDGELLLAQRAHHKAQDPGVWGTAAAGKLEPGESFDKALAREVREELALQPGDYTPHFLFEKTFAHPDGEPRRFGIYYAVLPKAAATRIRIDPNEVAGTGWFSLAKVRAMMQASPEELVPSANALWPEIFAALQTAGVLPPD